MIVEGFPQGLVIGTGCGAAGEDHDIQVLQRLLMQAETFTHQAFDAVAAHGGPDGPLADGEAQARMFQIIAAGQYGEFVIHGFTVSVVEYALELAGFQQPQAA
jgi:hypothetical protein